MLTCQGTENIFETEVSQSVVKRLIHPQLVLQLLVLDCLFFICFFIFSNNEVEVASKSRYSRTTYRPNIQLMPVALMLLLFQSLL